MHINGLTRASKMFATSTAIILLFGGASYAADANAVAERIKALYSDQGGELSFKNVAASGSDITLEGTTLKLPSSKEATEIGDIQLKNVEDGDAGAFKVGEITVPDIDIKEKSPEGDGTVLIKGIKMDNVVLPAQDGSNEIDKMITYEKSSIAEITIGAEGKGSVSLKDMEATLDAANKAEKIGFTFNVADFSANFKDVPENPLAAIEMDSLTGSITSKGVWNPKGGDFILDEFNLKANELGTLGLTGGMGGYDLAFLDAVKKTQKAMSEAEAGQDAAGLAMLGLAEQLSIKNLAIRFDNEKLTQKLLDYFAKQQGADAETLTQQVKMMVPLMATQLKNPEFTEQLKAASDKYFTDPKSLTISATPDQPVTFASIAATAGLDPTKIIQLLKVGVKAND